MKPVTPTLPSSANLDIGALSKTLDDTSASYKFLWVLGILDALDKRGFQESRARIPMREIFSAMLMLADAPVNRFMLSFGVSSGVASKDKMAFHLKAIAEAAGGKGPLVFDSADVQSPTGVALTKVTRELSAYVPLRWLSPFLIQHSEELRKAGGANRNQRKINKRIRELAGEQFKCSENPPPYCFEQAGGEECILMHPDWLDYFARNLPIVRGWATWKWSKFLQARNPNIPSVINKIIPPDEWKRDALQEQRESFWIPFLRRSSEVSCIYSGVALSAENFHLDHYIPWSFMGHNQIWNLIPADPSVNASKGDNLPCMKKYFPPFMKLHHQALVFHSGCSPSKWERLTESYVAGLRIGFADLTDQEKLERAYEATIPHWVALAAANRFTSDWIYSSTPKPDGT